MSLFDSIMHFFLTGTIVNTLGVVAGGLIGLFAGKIIPEHISKRIMEALGFCTLLISLNGVVTTHTFDDDSTVYSPKILLIIVSMVLGTFIGELIDLDGKVKKLGKWIETKLSKKGGTVSVAEGFVTGSLMFCVGAMAIVGSIESGLTGNNTTVFAKTLLDFVSSIIFASTLGIGIALSAAFVFVYQGLITVAAYFAGNILTNYMISQMSFVGNLIIIALSFNILKISNFKVMNFVPAIFLPIVLCLFM